MTNEEETGQATQLDTTGKDETVKATQGGSKALPIIALTGEDGVITETIVHKPQFYIGRSSQCDLVIEKLNTSRFHAFISYENFNSQTGEPICLIEDNTSKNGTYLNGVKITKPQRLKHGDRIVIGNMVMAFLIRREWELEASKKITEVLTKHGSRTSVGRVICDLDARLSVLVPDETFTPRKINVKVNDIDQGGLRLTSTEISKDFWLLLIRKKAYLRTEIELNALAIKLRGRMAWSHYDTKAAVPACNMGIEFQDLDSEQKMKLSQAIRDLSVSTLVEED